MSALSSIPLIRLPEGWPLPAVAALAMAMLAGLDLLGAYSAKHWAEQGSIRALLVGVLAFVVLFWVYASSLKYAELAVVTMGWIVLLQVGILVIDRVAFQTSLPTGKLAAVGIILAAQGYLLLAPSTAPGAATGPPGGGAGTAQAAGSGPGGAPVADPGRVGGDRVEDLATT